MTIDSADDSKISNWTITTNRISNHTYDSESNHEASQVPTVITINHCYSCHVILVSFLVSVFKPCYCSAFKLSERVNGGRNYDQLVAPEVPARISMQYGVWSRIRRRRWRGRTATSLQLCKPCGSRL